MSASLIISFLLSEQKALATSFPFLFRLLYLLPQLITHWKILFFHWTFYFVSPSWNYCLVIIVSPDANIILVSSSKLHEDIECMWVRSIFFTTFTSLSCTGMLSDIDEWWNKGAYNKNHAFVDPSCFPSCSAACCLATCYSLVFIKPQVLRIKRNKMQNSSFHNVLVSPYYSLQVYM